jgi:DNA-binding transcriptional ArsR family regulator
LMTAKPSPSVELDWALSGALRVTRETQPALWDFYQQHPELAERVRGLWGPAETLSYPCFLELSALAFGGGLLFGLDNGTFVSRLGELCLDAPEDLAFAAEAPADRTRLHRRLYLLRNDERVRDNYVEVVAEVWDALRGIWESEGRAAVDSTVTEVVLSLRGQLDPAELAMKYLERNACTNISRDDMTRLIEGLGDGGELVFVPAFFTAKGLVADLPGLLIIGMPAKPVAVAARARTESLARRLKAIADPTRLAILDALMQRDMSITEVTNLFGLAQPTVSNHVKQLRDAGVVTSSSDGKRRQLTVRREVVSEIITALNEIFDLNENRSADARE